MSINLNKSLTLFIAFIAIIVSFVSGFSQTDPNERTSNKAYPLKLVFPMAINQGEYSNDAIISFGPFDNYMISNNNGFAETDIIVNPRNSANFVATDNRITGFSGSPFVYYTTDGGVVWNQTSVSSSQGDPVFAADSLGNFYLAALANGVRLYKSSNNGATWTNLGNIVNNVNADKECIWADQTSGSTANNVYMAYVNFATGASVDFWRSVNNGTSWSFVGNMGTGNPNPGPDITSGPTGRVYLAWYGGTGTSLKVSTDGGASFGSTITASAHSDPGSVNASGRYVLKGDIRVNGMPHVACDMTNGPYRGYVYCIYAANPPGPDAADIFLTRSTDGGLTWNWTTPVRVNDDATFFDQWMCDVSVDNLGRIWAMWWDSRNDAGNLLTETYAAVSTNGGVSFSTNFKASNQNFNPAVVKIYQGANHYYLGDYQGISGRAYTFPCWTGQNNTLQDYVCYLPDHGIAFSRSIDSVNPGSTSVVRVYGRLNGPYSGTVTYNAVISPSPAPGTINFTWSPSNQRTYNGNPDSLTLNSLVSSNVPLNLYTVTVTGAESGGPRSHIRTFQIRVGNFVGISGNGSTAVKYSLSQNYPNPFNPSTKIDFSLPKGSYVTLKVYDVLGREVSSLINNELKPSGFHSVELNSAGLTSGVYYYKLIAGEFSDVKKMILIK